MLFLLAADNATGATSQRCLLTQPKNRREVSMSRRDRLTFFEKFAARYRLRL